MILVKDQNILAVDITETDTEILAADAIYPKHVLGVYELIDVVPPEDYAPGKYRWDGVGCVVVPPILDPVRVAKETTNAIQRMLDDKAREYRYDSIHTACGWADMFADAMALKTWGASCWIKAKEIETAVLAGTRSLPTASEVLAEMPEFVL